MENGKNNMNTQINSEHQLVFRKERFTIDAIHILRHIMEKTYEYMNMEVHILFRVQKSV